MSQEADVSVRRDESRSAYALLAEQYNYVLLVLSNASSGATPEFEAWYRTTFKTAMLSSAGVLSGQNYVQHEVDISKGRLLPLPFRYLGIYRLNFDGAENALGLLRHVEDLHRACPAAQMPANWLFYPATEKVGKAPAKVPSLLTIAFANTVEGQEAEFREWYATRHIRHALKIDALVSGQCFVRTQFQSPGAFDVHYHTIALYEQDGSPEDIIRSFDSLDPQEFAFPALHPTVFAEWVYQPL